MQSNSFEVMPSDRAVLRDLAVRVQEYANLPVMEERKRRWYAHNALESGLPMVIVEMETFIDDMMPPLVCSQDNARTIEYALRSSIVHHEMIDDDKVVPDYYPISWRIVQKSFGLDVERKHASDAQGREIGYEMLHPITDLKTGLGALQASERSVDREATLGWSAFVDDVIGDILPTRLKNDSLTWCMGLTGMVVYLMGMESMLVSMMDTPDEFHQFMGFMRDDRLGFLNWQQDENLLILNNENDFVGAGSYGFTTELPKSKEYAETGHVTSIDLWGNTNSQESVGISPAMYADFVFPYYRDLASHFGLLYYGCCESTSEIWDTCLSTLPNLRKVSISKWCNEEFMGERLRGGKVIYSRKPVPNFIGVGHDLDEEAFAAHIKQTLQSAQGCTVEFIYRDVLTVSGNPGKPGRAVKIIRDLIGDLWK